jgi:hypothetical protein
VARGRPHAGGRGGAFPRKGRGGGGAEAAMGRFGGGPAAGWLGAPSRPAVPRRGVFRKKMGEVAGLHRASGGTRGCAHVRSWAQRDLAKTSRTR